MRKYDSNKYMHNIIPKLYIYNYIDVYKLFSGSKLTVKTRHNSAI